MSIHIHLLQATKLNKVRSSKDTNGGYGTANDFGQGIVARLLKSVKRGTMNFPEILPAYANAILKSQGHMVTYAQNAVPSDTEILLIQTSIINFQEELKWAEQVRKTLPHVRIGFIGGMSAANPQLYMDHGDFVIHGEAENALLTRDISSLSGRVDGGLIDDLDALPFPDWSYLQRFQRGYGLVHPGRGRFFPLLSSRGCPMSCSYYCTYPLVQGAKFRARSPENVLEEIAYLQKHYQMQTVMFRDPIFSLDMRRVVEICERILKQELKFTWICETHPRWLTPEVVRLMARAGCTAVKLGIESGNLEVMKKSHRAAPDLSYQQEIIDCLEKNQIDVLAFYIIGYYDDTEHSVLQTIHYAEILNTYGAQFTIATPYPGTLWYQDLLNKPEQSQLDEDFEHYNQYRLVYRHPILSFDDIERLKSLAYRRYYLRWSYLKKHILQK